MHKQSIAYLLQLVGSVAAVLAGFVVSLAVGLVVLAVVATVHGVALERESTIASSTPTAASGVDDEES